MNVLDTIRKTDSSIAFNIGSIAWERNLDMLFDESTHIFNFIRGKLRQKYFRRKHET